jgi:hypothetical protein
MCTHALLLQPAASLPAYNTHTRTHRTVPRCTACLQTACGQGLQPQPQHQDKGFTGSMWTREGRLACFKY